GPLWEPTTDDRRKGTIYRAPTNNDRPLSVLGGQLQRTTDNRQQTTDNLQSAVCNLQSAVAEALAGLGVTEDDGPLLEGTARGLAELFRTSPQSPAAPDRSSDT
ncbi:MAG TPA: hypothetical protein VF909_21145, partial [Roseiflexaceae bacterium]